MGPSRSIMGLDASSFHMKGEGNYHRTNLQAILIKEMPRFSFWGCSSLVLQIKPRGLSAFGQQIFPELSWCHMNYFPKLNGWVHQVLSSESGNIKNRPVSTLFSSYCHSWATRFEETFPFPKNKLDSCASPSPQDHLGASILVVRFREDQNGTREHLFCYSKVTIEGRDVRSSLFSRVACLGWLHRIFITSGSFGCIRFCHQFPGRSKSDPWAPFLRLSRGTLYSTGRKWKAISEIKRCICASDVD